MVSTLEVLVSLPWSSREKILGIIFYIAYIYFILIGGNEVSYNCLSKTPKIVQDDTHSLVYASMRKKVQNNTDLKKMCPKWE